MNFSRFQHLLSKNIGALLGPNWVKSLSIVILILIFRENLLAIIADNLTLKEFESHRYKDTFLLISFITGSVYLSFKAVKGYQFGKSLTNLLSILTVTHLMLRFDGDNYWEYLCFFDSPIAYVDVVFIWPVLWAFSFISRNYPNELNKKPILVEDNPVQRVDEIDFLIQQCKQIIQKDRYKRAFSIGIIGPWGSGKSSIINNLLEELKHDAGNKAVLIQVTFNPFLSHSKEEFVTDFFNALGSNLKKYSGRLDSTIAKYAKSLVDVQGSQIIKEVSNYVIGGAEKGLHDMYNDIKRTLEEIDVKIVVVIDDLDRLEANEILDVLRLVRNTANFPNTVFIVAFDKSYVLKALSENKKYMDASFLEKFFQLEIFVPRVEVSKKLELAIDLLNESNGLHEEWATRYRDLYIEAIQNPDVLFEQYIATYRDVKKHVNQLVFECPLIFREGEEVDLVDLINFTFLKLEYPKFFIELCNEPRKYLEFENGLISPMQNSGVPTFEHLPSEHKPDLLHKTMTSLFNRQDSKIGSSIRRIAIFFRLIRLNYSKNDLSIKEFDEIVSNPSQENISKTLAPEKSKQLLQLLEYQGEKDLEKAEPLIKVLLMYIDQQWQNENVDIAASHRILRAYLNPYFEGAHEQRAIALDIVNSIFKTDDYDIRTRTGILRAVYDNRGETRLWGFDNSEYVSLCHQQMSDFLESFSSGDPINAQTFMRLFHDIKEIGIDDDTSGVNVIFKDFVVKKLSLMNVRPICEILMDRAPTRSNTFKLGDATVEIFTSLEQYEEFLKSHKSHNDPFFKKYMEFVHFVKITRNIRYLKFDFNPFLPEERFSEHPKLSATEARRSDQLKQCILVAKKQELLPSSKANIPTKKRSQPDFKFKNPNIYPYEGNAVGFYEAYDEYGNITELKDDLIKAMKYQINQTKSNVPLEVSWPKSEPFKFYLREKGSETKIMEAVFFSHETKKKGLFNK